MANDFSSDANCKAVWNFNSDLTDSKGSNDLTGYNTVEYDAADYKVGSAALKLDNNRRCVPYLADASLSAGFPFKNGDTNHTISIGMWFKVDSSRGVPDNGTWTYLIGKYASGKFNFDIEIRHWNNSALRAIGFRVGYSSGNLSQAAYHGSTWDYDKWYHIGVTLDGSENYRIRIWDDDAGAILGVDLTGTFGNVVSDGEDADFVVCGRNIAETEDIYFNGWVDEVAVFSDMLSQAEIDQIRGGTYNFAADANCEGLWVFDGDLTDSKNSNDLGLPADGTAEYDTTDKQEGTSSLYAVNYREIYAEITDANLDSGFPYKSGEANQDISYAYWLKLTSLPLVANTVWRLFAKSGSLEINWFAAYYYYPAITDGIGFAFGYSNGVLSEAKYNNVELDVGTWYHVCVTFVHSTKAYKIKVWDDDAGAYVLDTSGVLTNSPSAPEVGPFRVGGDEGVTDFHPAMKIDELVVWNDELSEAEMESVKDGTFGGDTATEDAFFMGAAV